MTHVHLFFPAILQTSVYDYEGWAHGRGELSKDFDVEGTPQDAQTEVEKRYSPYLYGIDVNNSWIVDASGRKHKLTRKPLT